MRSRNRRFGRRTLPRTMRRNTILPAPGFLPLENGQQLTLGQADSFLDAVPQQLLARPQRPSSSETARRQAEAVTAAWLRAAQGPSVN